MTEDEAARLHEKASGKPWTLEDREAWALAARQGSRLPLSMLLDRIVGAPSDAAAAKVMRRDGWGEVRGHNSRWMRTLQGQARRVRRIWQQTQKEQKR